MNTYHCGIRLGVVIALWLSCVKLAAAQQPNTMSAQAGSPGAASQSSDEGDRAALRALIPLYEEAASQGKPELLKPHLDPQFSGVMVTNEAVSSFGSLEAFWANMKKTIGAEGTYRVKVNLAEKSIISGDMAVAHGTTNDHVTTASGKEYDFEGNWTAVLHKRDGQWKVLRVHSSMNPISNPFVGSLVRWSSVTWGIIGGIAGLIIGWILHLLIAKRRKAPVGTPQSAA